MPIYLQINIYIEMQSFVNFNNIGFEYYVALHYDFTKTFPTVTAYKRQLFYNNKQKKIFWIYSYVEIFKYS